MSNDMNGLNFLTYVWNDSFPYYDTTSTLMVDKVGAIIFLTAEYLYINKVIHLIYYNSVVSPNPAKPEPKRINPLMFLSAG